MTSELTHPAAVNHSSGSFIRSIWRQWGRFIVSGNPFYLASILLLLFGLYRVSVDPSWFSSDALQLIFQFGSLQFYQVALVATAVFLAARAIWHDATLLIVLQGGLLMVPFILVSHEALDNAVAAPVLCAVGGVMGCALGFVLAARVKVVNGSWRLLILGCVAFAVNAGLPFHYRDSLDVGNDAWETFHTASWLFLVPALAAAPNVLPRARTGPCGAGPIRIQAGFIPVVWSGLWTISTGVHLWSIAYLDDRGLALPLLAPGVWAMGWTCYFRRSDFGWRTPSHGTNPLWVFIAASPLLLCAADPIRSGAIPCVLMTLNFAIFTVLFSLRRSEALLWFAAGSAGLALATLPLSWGVTVGFDSRTDWLLVAAGLWGFMALLRVRRPVPGVLAALTCGLVGAGLAGVPFGGAFLIVQIAAPLALLHSLRWENPEPLTRRVRLAILVSWFVPSVFWLSGGAQVADVVVPAMGVVVLVGATIHGYKPGRIAPPELLGGAGAMILLDPVLWFIVRIGSLPLGLVAIALSFVLLAAGTWFALRRDRMPHGENGKQC